MEATASRLIRCPVCDSQGAMLHHDIRASLVYSCKHCTHEWQLDPAEQPLPTDMAAEPLQAPARSRSRREP